MNATTQDTTPCRCCGEDIDIKRWELNGRDSSILTCQNVECNLNGYTFSLSDYDKIDLSLYGVDLYTCSNCGSTTPDTKREEV